MGLVRKRVLCAAVVAACVGLIGVQLDVAGAAPSVIRVNAGGGAVAGFVGDRAFTGAMTATTVTRARIRLRPEVSDIPAAVFQTERWSDNDVRPLTYRFPVKQGKYRVRLLFAEIYQPAFDKGFRKFNVDINGSRVLTDYDIYSDVGANTGTQKAFTTNASKEISVVFTHSRGGNEPKISGIVIESVNGQVEKVPPATVATTATTAKSGLSCSAAGSNASSLVAVTGATPNDSGDDTNAIQSAIDRAGASGGVVRLPVGRFVINGHLVMRDNVKLIGAGSSTVLQAGPSFLSKPGPAGGYPIVTSAGASNITIANLTADQRGDVLNGNVDGRLTEYLVDVRNSTNVVIDGVYTRNPFTYSIAIVASDHFCVTHSNTQVATSGRYDQLDGIHILDSSNGQVINNYVDQRVGTDGDDGLVAHTIEGPVHDVVYANNKVRGGVNGAGMQLALGNQPIGNIIISNNEFWGAPTGIHTGYYDGSADVSNVSIAGNYFHYDGSDRFTAIDIGGQGGASSVKVTNNRVCNNGRVNVTAGQGNSVSGTSC